MKLKRIAQIIAAALFGGSIAPAATINVTTDVTGNVTWIANNTYILQTVVYVRSNAVLTIEPGTVVKGATNVNTLVARDGIPNLVSALWVARGGKLNATGTVDRPIIMTFEGDDLNSTTDVPYNTSGQWGGVVLCGRARINSAQFAAGEADDPKYERFEGTTTAGQNDAHYFGGSNDNDDSGELRYVSIRYPGNVFAPARELNGLTMAAVGRGTTIEYIEVLNSSDDAFEWWGGTVNTRYLVAAFCEDDDFDTDQGYRGTNQFWFGIKPPWNGSSDSRGFESDGDLNQTGYPGNNATPFSSWVVYNATLIGRGTNASGFGGGIGWNARDEARPGVYNTIFSDFASGMLIDTDGTNEFATGVADVRSSIFHVGTGLSGATAADMSFLFSQATRTNTLQNPLLSGVSYTNNAGLNPRPQSGSPALSNVRSHPAGLQAVNYRGAFAPNDTWADGWTALSTLGVLATNAPGGGGGDGRTINITVDITGNVTWRSTNTYILQTVVYVRSNAVLTIEPGTVVKGATNVNTLVARDGIPNLVSALWVARGGKLYATGTVDRPIIMTFEGDDLESTTDVPYNTSGQWGGVVLCGRARINSAQFAAGEADDPKYERFEGTTTAGQNDAHYFGGSNDNDDSGELRYVSIRYPGNVFAPARELNGLTMAAVGRGTIVEYIEVLNSSDDAFEWWGGTVNTRYLVAAFCEDDDFDTDQGYRGTNQFWFGIKPPWNGSSDSRGFESDGDLNQTGYPGNNATPFSSWVVYNATLIGRGTNASGFGGGVGWNARDEARPSVYNTIFSEFASGMLIDTDGTNEFASGVADVRSSIFHVGTGLSGATAADMGFLFGQATRTNTLQNPLLSGVSYTNNAGLNPRPQSGSPALSNVRSQPAGLQAVNYRGAFAPNDTWADGWTALSTLAFLSPPPLEVAVTKGGSDVHIAFRTMPGATYQLQSTTSLSTPAWSNDGDAVTGTGSSMTFNRSVGTTGVRFFRVVTAQ